MSVLKLNLFKFTVLLYPDFLTSFLCLASLWSFRSLLSPLLLTLLAGRLGFDGMPSTSGDAHGELDLGQHPLLVSGLRVSVANLRKLHFVGWSDWKVD